MADQNTPSKNVLQFGKATMYVISELGLQTEPVIHGKAVNSKVFLEKTMFSGKKVNYSRSRAIDFSWKEVTKASDQAEGKIKILDLNGFTVDQRKKLACFLCKKSIFCRCYEPTRASKSTVYVSRGIKS